MAERKTAPPMEQMMAYLDGEMPPKDRRAFERLLDEHPEWREETQWMRDVVGATEKLHLRAPDPSLLDNYWEEIDDRLKRRFGWIVALFGSILLIAFGFWKALMFTDNPLARSGVMLVALGLMVLFYVVLKGRLVEIPRDRYGRIRR